MEWSDVLTDSSLFLKVKNCKNVDFKFKGDTTMVLAMLILILI